MNPTDQTPPADDQAVMPEPTTGAVDPAGAMPAVPAEPAPVAPVPDEATNAVEAPAEDASVQAPSDEVPPAPGM